MLLIGCQQFHCSSSASLMGEVGRLRCRCGESLAASTRGCVALLRVSEPELRAHPDLVRERKPSASTVLLRRKKNCAAHSVRITERTRRRDSRISRPSAAHTLPRAQASWHSARAAAASGGGMGSTHERSVAPGDEIQATGGVLSAAVVRCARRERSPSRQESPAGNRALTGGGMESIVDCTALRHRSRGTPSTLRATRWVAVHSRSAGVCTWRRTLPVRAAVVAKTRRTLERAAGRS